MPNKLQPNILQMKNGTKKSNKKNIKIVIDNIRRDELLKKSKKQNIQ